MADDKTKALETALSQIERQFGKGAVMRLGEKPPRMARVSKAKLIFTMLTSKPVGE